MNIYTDDRQVLTLDAGGTNFVFSAIRSGKPVTERVRLDANAHDLEKCIATMKAGFREIMHQITGVPAAISFAFPGPADYRNGIIGDLNNLPAFRGGVPLKAILEEEFNLPVFINNDGDLYAYGEALGGILPEINQRLEKTGNPKRYYNLTGLTLGTGFGGGVVRNGELFLGDNSIASEVWLFSSRYHNRVNAEDLVSTRSVQRVYAEQAGIKFPNKLMPKDIYDIAMGAAKGKRQAAQTAFEETGRALGDVVANLFTLTDGIVVIGGGITGARDLYMPAVMKAVHDEFYPSDNGRIPRLVQKIFNLDDPSCSDDFYKNYSREITVPGTASTVVYDPVPRLAIATSRIGASEAIALGAYALALNKMDRQ
ncbi:MAG: ROK family protein [Bacteroidota bacterium]